MEYNGTSGFCRICQTYFDSYRKVVCRDRSSDTMGLDNIKKELNQTK